MGLKGSHSVSVGLRGFQGHFGSFQATFKGISGNLMRVSGIQGVSRVFYCHFRRSIGIFREVSGNFRKYQGNFVGFQGRAQ